MLSETPCPKPILLLVVKRYAVGVPNDVEATCSHTPEDDEYCKRSPSVGDEILNVSMMSFTLSKFCLMSARAELIESEPASTFVVLAFDPDGHVGIVVLLYAIYYAGGSSVIVVDPLVPSPCINNSVPASDSNAAVGTVSDVPEYLAKLEILNSST